MNNRQVLDMLERLPDQIDPEQLIHELYAMAKLEWADSAAARSQVIGRDEVVVRTRQWPEEEPLGR